MTSHFRTHGPLFDGSANRRVGSVSRRWMQGVARVTRDTARQYAPVATGGFRASIVYRTYLKRGEVHGDVFSTMPEEAVNTIEHGRAPGKPMPPPGSLRAWLAVKGIDSRAEFAIARKIAREGYFGHFVFTRAFVKCRGLLNSQTNNLAVQIARELN